MHQLPRALRLRQQPSLLHRLPTQRTFIQTVRRKRPSTLPHPNGEPLRYQAVRFKRGPYFTWRRAVTIGLYTGAAYAYLTLFLRWFDVEVEILEDEESNQQQEQRDGREITPEEEEELLYADEDSTFIPLTWATKMPRKFYKGSDPEWQEFLKVARDKQRHRKIQEELVQMVYSGSVQHPMISRQLGKETKIGKYWLDISFPDGPPPEYQRSGIEIGDGYIAWSKQKVSQEQQWRLVRALWPQAMAESVWQTGKVLAGIQYRRVKQALGLEGKDPWSPEERYRHAVEMMKARQQNSSSARERKEVSSSKQQAGSEGAAGTVVSTGTGDSPVLPTPPSSGKTSATGAAAGRGDDKRPSWMLNVPIPSADATASGDLPIAMHVFSSTLSKQWNPKKSEPPRGTFVVQGLIEVRGSQGRMLFDVQSCYDPKAEKYVVVNAAVRSFKRWSQAPKGGP